jgi:GT2 family glycosyltransferase
MKVRINIGIVLYNSVFFIPNCLHSIFSQTLKDFDVTVVDNNSEDDSIEFISENYPQVKIIRNKKNYGFSRAHNQAIDSSESQFYLCLNPDVILTENFLEEITRVMDTNTAIGTATGKIYRIDKDFVVKPWNKVIDSTGIYLTRNMRHLDRGSGEKDTGQYDKTEYVFGATGACCLYRREMLNDIKILGEYFDNDFFFSREDVDISWRSQIAGWKTVYIPSAVSYHLRTVLPERRSSLPKRINMHSVKNRYLLQIKNHTLHTYLKTFPYALFREFLVFSAILLNEQYSLKGFFFVIRNFKKIVAKRKLIMQRRKVSNICLVFWFRHRSLQLSQSQSK